MYFGNYAYITTNTPMITRTSKKRKNHSMITRYGGVRNIRPVVKKVRFNKKHKVHLTTYAFNRFYNELEGVVNEAWTKFCWENISSDEPLEQSYSYQNLVKKYLPKKIQGSQHVKYLMDPVTSLDITMPGLSFIRIKNKATVKQLLQNAIDSI